MCGPGGPHDSRPGGRRYSSTNELLVAVGDEPGFGEVEGGFGLGLGAFLHLLPGEFDEDVGLDVEGCARGEGVEVGAPVGEGENRDPDGVGVDSGDCEADAFNRN